MTTEDDFVRALDAEPENHFVRGLFAEWLSDHDDPRAEGMLALSARGAYPMRFDDGAEWTWWTKQSSLGSRQLPPDWWLLLTGTRPAKYEDEVNFTTRCEAEDAAALAFARLPASRRAELLNTAPVGVA